MTAFGSFGVRRSRWRRGNIVGLLFVLSLFFARAALAEDATGLRLFVDNSLVGWDYGEIDPATAAPRGWVMKDRQLTGAEGAARLLSGFSLGDFELRLGWKVTSGGTCKLLLPVTSQPAADVPDRYATPQWELTLREGDSCGTLADNWGVHAAGGAVDARPDGSPHATVLRRAGGKLSLTVDDRQLYEIEIRPELRFGIGLDVAAGEATIADLQLVEPAGELLLEPGTYTGWWAPKGTRPWVWEGDELVCRGHGGDYLRTENDEWENFTLTFDYKLAQRGNSGIGIRTPRAGWPSGDGIELQLYDEADDAPLNRHSSMALYGNLEPLARADRRDEWNHAVVKADGYLISAWINGQLVQHANTWRMPELKYRHLKGWIGLQDHGGRVRFRNVRATAAPPGRGSSAWYAKHPEPAAMAVFDRLMNPLRLAYADGIQVAEPVDVSTDPADETLAKFSGPGAVVAVAMPDDKQQLAWYFDGEAQPRLTCSAAELIHKVPCVDHEAQPPLVWIPFARELKITRAADSATSAKSAGQGSGSANYFEAVTLPASLAVHSWEASATDVPRGLLPACSYRFHQMDGGRLRDLATVPTHASSARSLAPDERADVLDLPGSGVAQWLSLAAPAKALASDDLWIEVAVDGESTPSLSAPARYWFPGCAAKKSWHNFVLTSDYVDNVGQVYTNRLAIPFGHGFRVTLVNRGSKKVDRLSARTSVIPGDDPLLTAGLPTQRLRGLFASPSSASDENSPLELKGHGRLVGVVCQSPDDAIPHFAELSIDGESQPAGAGYALAAARVNQANAPLFQPLGGRAAGLAWHYFLLGSVDFERSLAVAIAPRPAHCWLLYYVEPQ